MHFRTAVRSHPDYVVPPPAASSAPSLTSPVLRLLTSEEPKPRNAADIALAPKYKLSRLEALMLVWMLLSGGRQKNYGRINALLNRAAMDGLLDQDEVVTFRRQADGQMSVTEPKALLRGRDLRVQVARRTPFRPAETF